ncbi:hypothetical protein NECAME_07461 [Necator americanus]|uniref:Reverse transcriptase domain-containing protein n=1 Tax=Necator americanus TaxID=51031 RepID=W2TNE8_NECAM|nr:hypothetical protein NECAME_07461 [Necator americanus]ETN83273.1 hypothetical protein NECAME_07461 [Necator americanus]
MLIRFRVGHIAMIADVEKAFLQVHLNVEDRDAARCLWVRDLLQPPEGLNIVTYRFTRVTFGLNCSPFLLAETIKYHLQGYTKHAKLAKELHDNVYVDNVIFTASNTEEALKKYKESKAIFTEMNMNLRGYLSNDDEINDAIPPQDKSWQLVTKVFGIMWNSPGYSRNRRTFLWKSGYDWDTKLLSEYEQEWIATVAQVNGYKRVFEISPLHSHVKLVVFADASTQAVAACAYIVAECASHLVFARSKLANVKEQMTSVFYDEIKNRLPVRRPWISFEAVRNTEVIAKIPTLVTAELLVTFKRDVTAAIEEVTDSTCTISNTIAQGCYHCTQGAVSNVTCTSTKQATRAAIRCDDKHFTVPCSPEGTTSQIRFTHTQARLKLKCTVSFGTRETSFEISEILRWVRTIYETVKRIIDGESIVHDEIVLSDIAHIADIIFSGYKSSLHYPLLLRSPLTTHSSGHAGFEYRMSQRAMTISRSRHYD